MAPYVVCGWYTPDYARWAERLRHSLELHNQPFDLVLVEKDVSASWEASTMRKARETLKAVQRHRDKTVVMVDVDCTVEGDLAELVQLRGDVAFYFHPRRRRSGVTKAHVRSGTMVIKPTADARRFVERWVELSDRSQFGDVDQDTLLLALSTPGVLFEHLDVKWCCTKSDDCLVPIIRHSSASKGMVKISTTKRRLVGLASTILGDRNSTRA